MPAPEASPAPPDVHAADLAVALPAALLALAGFVDAVAFLGFGGVFVAFMSGDTTRLALAWARGDRAQAALLASAILLFVVGAAAGRALSVGASPLRRSAVLTLVGLLLAGAAVAGRARADAAALILSVTAMGAQNAVLHRAGGAPVTLTYVTGALVRLGEAMADLAMGRPAPDAPAPALLWLGVAGGAAMGAAAFARFGVAALAAPGALALALAAVLALAGSSTRPRRSAP